MKEEKGRITSTPSKKAFSKYKLPIFLIIAVVTIILLWYFDIYHQITKENIQMIVESSGFFAPPIFILLYIISLIFFLPATPLSLAAGFIFGGWFGTLYTVIGATIGATVAFIIARYFAFDSIDALLKNRFKKIHKYDTKLKKQGLPTVLFLRFVPLFPFNGLNFALGITHVKLKDFIIGTAAGIIPGSFILVNIGASVTDISSPKLYLFITAFILMGFIPTIYKRFKKK